MPTPFPKTPFGRHRYYRVALEPNRNREPEPGTGIVGTVFPGTGTGNRNRRNRFPRNRIFFSLPFWISLLFSFQGNPCLFERFLLIFQGFQGFARENESLLFLWVFPCFSKTARKRRSGQEPNAEPEPPEPFSQEPEPETGTVGTVFSESVKRRFSKCRFSVLNLKFDFISDGGCTREKQIHKALGSLPPCGNRCRFSESAICSSRVHPPSEIKSNFKFKTLRWRPLRWRLTLSDFPRNRTRNRNRRNRFSTPNMTGRRFHRTMEMIPRPPLVV